MLAGPAVVISALALVAGAWRFTELRSYTDVATLVAVVDPYRDRWWTLGALLATFVLAELLLFPILVLIFLCGVLFGPLKGSIYGLTGAVAGALIPFLAGRRLGRARLERWGGPAAQRLMRSVDERGIVAVYLARKVPLPFTITNLICGASGVRLRDFVLGTLLGMGAVVVLVAGLGGQLAATAAEPSAESVELAAGILMTGIGASLVIQRLLDRRTEAPLRHAAKVAGP